MSDRICFKCDQEFKYPSFLKTHLKTSSRCRLTDEEYENFINPKKQFICNKCNKNFCNNSSLTRHCKTSKCAQSIPTQNNKLNDITIGQINELNPELAKNILLQLIDPNKVNNNTSNSNVITTTNNNNQNINNINDNNNNVNNNINDNSTNNNNINNGVNIVINNNVTHIRPAGYEDIRLLSKDEMKTVLKAGKNAGLEIIKLIYNKMENKNFYKYNLGQNNISCLNDKYEITVHSESVFANYLFSRSIRLLYQILCECKDDFKFNEVSQIYDNIEFIQKSMRSEIYNNHLKNIVESEIRNNNNETKRRITNYISKLKTNPAVKQEAIKIINEIIETDNNLLQEYEPTITDSSFNEQLGIPSEARALQIDNNLDTLQTSKDIYDTEFYNYWTTRIDEERDIVRDSDKKSLGDILNITQRKKQILENINKVITKHKEIDPNDINESLLTFPNLENIEIKNNINDYINFNELHNTIENP